MTASPDPKAAVLAKYPNAVCLQRDDGMHSVTYPSKRYPWLRRLSTALSEYGAWEQAARTITMSQGIHEEIHRKYLTRKGNSRGKTV